MFIDRTGQKCPTLALSTPRVGIFPLLLTGEILKERASQKFLGVDEQNLENIVENAFEEL